MTLLSKIRKHRDYRRTVGELKNLPLNVALDLDIFPGDAEKIARRAVWGQ